MTPPDAQAKREHHPHAERRRCQKQHRQQDAHVGRFGRAHVVSTGVRNPATTSVVRSAAILAMTRPGVASARDRGAADPAEQKNRKQHDASP